MAQISIREREGVTIVEVVGELSFREGTSREYGNFLKNLVEKGVKKILVNMTQVPYVDSSGIKKLVSAQTIVTEAGGTLKMYGLQERVENLLQMIFLYADFDIYKNEDTAIKSFQD